MPTKKPDEKPVAKAAEPLEFIPDPALVTAVEAAPPPAKVKPAATTAPLVPQFPGVPASGQWSEAEHDQAIAAYEHALDTKDPDAGRLRSLIGLYKNSTRGILRVRTEI